MMAEINANLIEEIVRTVEEIEITATDAWADLDVLSTHTFLDSIQVEPEGIVTNGEVFSGIASVYVTLQYGSDSDDGFTTSDSFLGEFKGTIDNGVPVVDEFTVDTSSFYEFGEDPEDE